MPDWPQDVVDFTPYATLSSGDENCPVADYLSAAGIVLSGNGSWSVASVAVFVPILVRTPVTVYQLAWGNGPTLGSNVDVGLYDGTSKARLVSTGSTAQAGVSTLQAVDVADTPVPVGLHYLAMVVDTTTGFVNRGQITSTPGGRMCGMAQQASGFPLPSTATFAPLTSITVVPLVIAAIESGVF
jgi:hypothetical protein